MTTIFHQKKQSPNRRTNPSSLALGALLGSLLVSIPQPLRAQTTSVGQTFLSVERKVDRQAGMPALPPDKDYLVYVLSEAADRIALIRFGPNGARIDHEFPTGDMPVDIDGPHGIVVSPDKKFYYVSLAHGRPFGSVWKYSTKDARYCMELWFHRTIATHLFPSKSFAQKAKSHSRQ